MNEKFQELKDIADKYKDLAENAVINSGMRGLFSSGLGGSR